MINWTITVGNLIEILVIVIGGVVAISSFKQSLSTVQTDVVELKDDIKALNKVVVQMAVTDQRLLAVEQDIRDLQRGKGFIHEEIKGEWPRRGG